MASFILRSITVAFCFWPISGVLSQSRVQELPEEVRRVIDSSQFGGPIERNQFGFPTFGGAGRGEAFANGLNGRLDGNPNDPVHGFMFQDFPREANLPVTSSSRRPLVAPVHISTHVDIDPSLSAWINVGQTQPQASSSERSDLNFISSSVLPPADLVARNSLTRAESNAMLNGRSTVLAGSLNDSELNAWLGAGRDSSTQRVSSSNTVDRVRPPYLTSVGAASSSSSGLMQDSVHFSSIQNELNAWINGGGGRDTAGR